MRYRALSATGDMQFGHGSADFLVNSPAAVAQSISTRLKLWVGEWFLDQTQGTPWMTKVLGSGTSGTYDQAIRARILGTRGVISITSYSSARSGTGSRSLAVTAQVLTAYGTTTPFTMSLPTS